MLFLRDLAQDRMERASVDFYRLNWIRELDKKNEALTGLLKREGPRAYALTVEEDPTETVRWLALAELPPDTLGRQLLEFYKRRGFKLPGQVGGGKMAVAQHDWMHAIANYGTTPMGEIEVLGFHSTCSESPGSLLGLVGALALFESGA